MSTVRRRPFLRIFEGPFFTEIALNVFSLLTTFSSLDYKGLFEGPFDYNDLIQVLC